ncbi:hypothetical protein [uncultured Gammaproteobacteria bacterium]|jgi:SAM-dependent methyltransferase|nr:hypothetical protein [uncultured Gammaproteobacteria bacterium]CAC9579331.1 hypothetical protein [uncultured Gammaproteobacteria bacterium]CAC9590786.1 hypothetical protein [uncultured Gammaproteobacteria bacterium]CAC9604674.1 hypothetical protein [uncultured Gammaproteobacteria bacterium]CAC9949937.1 hypothetical protein [uncultured Gammaproteobacteria bacterium]
MNLSQQKHLVYADRVNMGAYYTHDEYVRTAWDMLIPYINEKTIVLDSSCGYGNFLNHPVECQKVGNDIDTLAIDKAKQNVNTLFFNHNALNNISRGQYNIKEDECLCVIGNPPYNDKNSIIRQDIKSFNMPIDNTVKTRDLGMSFLLSYNELKAEFVCVLHPLSYLIKQANFRLLKNFTHCYQLIQGKIISSAGFSESSKSMQFPIVIALYRRNGIGTTYKDVINFSWDVEGTIFQLSTFDDISHYIKKYPNKFQQAKSTDLFFWTMRDINALKRNQTFVQKFNSNTIIIDKSKLDYYIYIDVFKQFSCHVPYYFGNCNVLIDNALFIKYKKYFILESLSRHQNLCQYFPLFDFSKVELLAFAKQKINQYFQQLLGVHYVD